MKKYKICVYAICKNEEKNIKRWLESIKDADAIYVLDTGSTDNSYNLLKEHGVIVKQEIINPWRFDIARNKSLEMVPSDTDICICLDIDEVLSSNWRNVLENIWDSDLDRLSYPLNYHLDEYQRPVGTFNISKIHKRENFKWVYPIHEVLVSTKDNCKQKITSDIYVNHLPDNNKPRDNYLELLELSYKENPFDSRICHYLGREYMYKKRYNEAIDMLINHLNLKSSTWDYERCASLRFIARCYKYLKRYEEARLYLDKAVLLKPKLKEVYGEYVLVEYEAKDYEKAIYYLDKALEIKEVDKSYISEVFCWDSTLYDIGAICMYNLNNKEKALYYVNKAIEMNPNNLRLLENKKIISKM